MTHPAINGQISKLIEAAVKARASGILHTDPNVKLLAALYQLMFTDVPNNPGAKKFRQGKTLGMNRKHWFRAKFGSNRFRLFYRYSSKHKTIIYGWVNDSETLRTYGSKTDAYAVFKSMLDDGSPPDGWDELMRACGPLGVDTATAIAERIQQALAR